MQVHLKVIPLTEQSAQNYATLLTFAKRLTENLLLEFGIGHPYSNYYEEVYIDFSYFSKLRKLSVVLLKCMSM